MYGWSWSLFLAFALFPYTVGFLLLCFWWRLESMLLAWGVAFAFAAWASLSVGQSDGLDMGIAYILLLFLIIGAVSGAVASVLVIRGRASQWRLRSPLIILPIVFVLGPGSYITLDWIRESNRQARLAPPSEACLNGLHPGKFADIDVAIPLAPGLSLIGDHFEHEYYFLGSNSDARAFCRLVENDDVKLAGIRFKVDERHAIHTARKERPFCLRKRADYPWGDMACNPAAYRANIENPISVDVGLARGRTDWEAEARDDMRRSPVSTAPDGLKIYRAADAVYLERPDSYFARCSRPTAASQPLLYCTVRERLPQDLIISYTFEITEAEFLVKTPLIAAKARAIFDSLRR